MPQSKKQTSQEKVCVIIVTDDYRSIKTAKSLEAEFMVKDIEVVSRFFGESYAKIYFYVPKEKEKRWWELIHD